ACASFTGAAGETHRDYVRCAKPVIKQAIAALELRRQCRAAALYPVIRSTCGYPDDAWQPCLRTSRAGKVSCKIKLQDKCDTKGDVSCGRQETCLDAADTNHDGRVSHGDHGGCMQDCAALQAPAAARCTAELDACLAICAGQVFVSCSEGCQYAYSGCTADVTAASERCNADIGLSCEALHAGASAYCAANQRSTYCQTRCQYTHYFDVFCYDSCIGAYDCTTGAEAAYSACVQL
ncbi:MAG TPA: hypothetical protein VEB21_03815, partial [Terriglobales bacterium]|nr:hypothetical protein [Terriglobales bacterium]